MPRVEVTIGKNDGGQRLSQRIYSNQSTLETMRRTLLSWFFSEPKYWLTRFFKALALPM